MPAPLEFELLPASASPSGQPRLRFRPAQLAYQAYPKDNSPKTSSGLNTSTRLNEIISRIGEICLSPALAHVMLFPVHALAYQSGITNNFPDARRDACHHPVTILDAMDDSHQHPDSRLAKHAAEFLHKFQLDSLPPPTAIANPQPVHVCAWRLEPPPHVCLYTGEHPANPALLDLQALAPHTLSKVLLEDDRTRRPAPSRIHLLPASGTPHDRPDIRTSLLHYAQTALTPYQARTTSSTAYQPQHRTALDTTLEEAFACMIHAPTRNHSQIELNASPPWDKDHIDSR